MEKANFIGAKIKDIKLISSQIEIITDKGVIISSEGDCGTMRNPEPYYSCRFLPLNYCNRWSGFGICGNEKPCERHDKKGA